MQGPVLTFWLVAGGMTLAVAAVLVATLLRRRVAAPAEAYDLAVYRAQLAETERDVARGAIPAAEAERVRTEVARRVLGADRALREAGAAPRPPRWLTLGAGLAVAALAGGSVWTYARIGAPGYPDLPIAARIAEADRARETRPRQVEAEAITPPVPAGPRDAKYLDLVAKLRAAVAARPDDLQGHVLLVQNEAGLGNFAAAHGAQAEVIRLKGDRATAADYTTLADLMIRAADGYVSPEAEAALTQALRRDGRDGLARYYSGLMFTQTGRFDLAFRIWGPLMDDTRPQDAWSAALGSQIGQAAALAGVPYEKPPAAPGPDAAAIASAEAMTPEARQEMIGGMVAGLADRLQSDGGSPEEWARLIRAYGVLGRAGDATTALADARAAYAGDDTALATIEAATR